MADFQTKKSVYFLLTFLTAAAVLSIIAGIAIYMIGIRTVPLVPEPNVRIPTTNYTPQSYDNLSVLLIGCEENDTPKAFLLMKFDAVRGAIPVLLLPPQLLVDGSGKKMVLENVYKQQGAQGTKMILEANLGITIDRYAQVDSESFIQIADTIGSIEYTMPTDLIIRAENGQVTIRAGNQLLDGKKIAGIIASSSYTQEDLERLKTASDLVVAGINQKMDIIMQDNIDDIFKFAVNLMDTDISYADYEARKNPAKFMLALGVQPAYSVLVSGSFNAGGNTFVLSSTAHSQIEKAFR